MKKLFFLSLLLLLVGCKLKQVNQEKINVLFIGNSLTYYHDMPKTLQAMLNENYSNYNIEQSAFAGMTLKGHLEDIIYETKGDTVSTRDKEIGEITETEKKLKTKKWDIIVLQEGTGRLYFPEVIKEVINPSIKNIIDFNNNPKCKYILFKTWTSKGIYPREKECVPKHYFDWKKYYVNEETSNKIKFCSSERLNLKKDVNLLNIIFDTIAKDNKISKTNHCSLHYKVRTEFPEIELYDDEYHPSESGSFFNALEFYRILTNDKIAKLKYVGKLDIKSAKKLKSVF
jgi:hypothetical protein